MKRILFGILVAALVSSCAVTVDQGGSGGAIASTDHWVQSVSAHDSTPVKLYLREKIARAADPAAVARSGKVVLLIHGAGTPGSVAFDLQVAGASGGTHSLMDYLAAEGFDVFALDYQNYGRSDKHECGLCVTTQAAAKDAQAAIDHIRKLRGVEKVHLLGWSWGSTVAGLVAASSGDKLKRVVLYAPPMWTGLRGQVPKEQFRKVTPQAARNLFEGPASDPAVVEAWAKEIAQWGPTAPNGVLVDLNGRMPINDPKANKLPTMIIVGDLDRATPIAEPNLPVFFSALPNTDKQLIIVPGAGHALTVQKQRMRFYREVGKWFSID